MATMEGEENPKERATWANGTEFLMSCIAMSVGLGNVWRFPFTAYENGGGAFLLPYIVCLIIIGKPLYYLEMVIGQFVSKEPVKLYETLAPVLKGIGVAQITGCCGVATYYCTLVGITLYYLYHSFTTDLPWTHCKPEWQSELKECVSAIESSSNRSNHSISSSELWYTKEVTKQVTNIDDGIGLPDPKLTIFLFASWSVLFLLTIKGIRSSGKAAYFLALFPYVIMFTLLIRAVTLEGSVKGILYFLKPQWDMLLEPKVWYNAVTQCFFSLGIGSGTIVMYASYNSFSHNVYRDAMIVTSIDTITSLISGITIFGVLGNLAHNLNVDVNDVISGGGTKLAFVSYPDAIAKFNAVPWLFAILFFTMLFVLGIGSMVGTHGCVLSVIKDGYPSLKNWYVSSAICLVGFAISVVYVTPGGEFVLVTVDYFMGTFLPFSIVILEAVAICWWYGVENVCMDIEFMCKKKIGFYWKICWGFITPVSLIVIFAYCVISIEPLTNGEYEIPQTLTLIGWSLFAFGILQLPIQAILFLCTKRKIALKEAIRESFSFKSWGPRSLEMNKEWNQFKTKKIEEIASKKQNWFAHKKGFFFG